MWFSPEIPLDIEPRFYLAYWSAISNLGEAINVESQRLNTRHLLDDYRIKVRPKGLIDGNHGKILVQVWTMGMGSIGTPPDLLYDFYLVFKFFDDRHHELSMRGKFQHFCGPGYSSLSSGDLFNQVTRKISIPV